MNGDDISQVLEHYRQQWKKEQSSLKQQLISVDAIDWDIDTLRFIGGVDISFIKDNNVDACACLVVLNYPQLEIVYQKCKMVQLQYPYIAGYLAFREVNPLLELIEELKTEQREIFPQVIIVDGNGILHPRGFGLACHLGVLADIPTVGVAKNFLFVDGMERNDIRDLVRQRCPQGGDYVELVGRSGTQWGYALRSTPDSDNPIFVSHGHRLSNSTSVQLIKRLCLYRVPEPTRQADLISRRFIRKLESDSS